MADGNEFNERMIGIVSAALVPSDNAQAEVKLQNKGKNHHRPSKLGTSKKGKKQKGNMRHPPQVVDTEAWYRMYSDVVSRWRLLKRSQRRQSLPGTRQ